MNKFKVGDVVILKCADYPMRNGRELTIKSVKANYRFGFIYITDFHVMGIYWAESALRKKPQDTTTWDEVQKTCHWSPNEAKA